MLSRIVSCVQGGCLYDNFLITYCRGCFLTSSLVATMAVSLTIPMAMFADIIFKEVKYPYIFYFGTIPMFLAFFAVTLLAHMENWDPVMDGVRKVYSSIAKRLKPAK